MLHSKEILVQKKIENNAGEVLVKSLKGKMLNSSTKSDIQAMREKLNMIYPSSINSLGLP